MPPGSDHQESLNNVIAGELAAQGWSVQPAYFSKPLIRDLLTDMRALDATGALTEAGVGRGGDYKPDTNIRNDRTLWLTGATDAPRDFLALMERLRFDLNRALFLGLFEYEAHYALYPPGGVYKKHLDSFRGGKNRLVSTVSYLTPGWREQDGGHLVLYDPVDHDREIARILPAAGTLAVFLSEEMPHEVLPPARERASIAGWFRCNSSSDERASPQK